MCVQVWRHPYSYYESSCVSRYWGDVPSNTAKLNKAVHMHSWSWTQCTRHNSEKPRGPRVVWSCFSVTFKECDKAIPGPLLIMHVKGRAASSTTLLLLSGGLRSSTCHLLISMNQESSHTFWGYCMSRS